MAATNSSELHQWLITSVQRQALSDSGSVVQWLQDVRLMTESECMCVLQGKSLNKDSTDIVLTSSKSSKDAIDAIQVRAHVINTEFSKLFRKVEKARWKQIQDGSLRLACQIRSLLQECTACLRTAPQTFTEQQQLVMAACAKLAQYVESHVDQAGADPDKCNVTRLLTDLGQSFSGLVDMALGALVKKLLSGLDGLENHYSVKLTLNDLVSLGLGGEHMCYLLAREGSVEKLFCICQQEDLQFAHSQALRAIATICCIRESVAELDRVGGVEHLSDILANKSQPEAVRAEAAGVIAQITSPTLEHYHHLPGFIEYMQDLVYSLTELCKEASTHEVFLLGCAALANMTFVDSMACDFLQQCGTAAVLIATCQSDSGHSLYTMDQVATVLANMSAVDGCWADVTSNQGIELLVWLTQQQIPATATSAESAAWERVQQKAAIALTRLSRDRTTAEAVIKLDGLPRLMQLCKDARLRNHSDAILVACLAALKKISGLCNLQDITTDAEMKQLIEPQPLDSFLACSGLDESIV